MATNSSFLKQLATRYTLRKSPEAIAAEAKDPSKSLKKTLGALDLTLLGVGAIIGAGIFVLAGVGATLAGPGIVFSFILAGFICALAGMAYAEMASTIPTSGSAYAYAYSSLGETIAWVLGWALVLEYAIGSAGVAVAWSGNFVALLGTFGVTMPDTLTCGYGAGLTPGGLHCMVNVPALVMVLALAALLVVGSKESAKLAGVLVAVKVAILLFVVAAGGWLLVTKVGFANWSVTPPAPDPNRWYHVLGASGGIVGAAAIIFFAYIGFDAVSTTAEETKRPQRDLPIGILGSLAICTLLYILASGVLVGLVPWTDFDANTVGAVATQRLTEPFGYAFQKAGILWAATLVRLGAVIGLASVMLVLLLGAPRIFFALARDGLMPEGWASVHPRFGTPWKTTIGVGISVALVAGFGSLGILAQITNIGTLFAFALVCVGVIVLRYTHPALERPFRVPWSVGKFPVLALLGAILCVGLMASLAPVTQLGFFMWMGLGIMVYALYGIRKSVLHRRVVADGATAFRDVGTAAAASEVDVVLEELR